ncbi:unnamed protein product [marine sediment metagenome]|uniref:Uncharacterized protein n=1 Tax=marine sediment metagenome TaxID=412755 RepID=X1IAN2_9ZZZZ
MGNGCYDLDGRCVNCKKLHPCDCETEQDEQDKMQQRNMLFGQG